LGDSSLQTLSSCCEGAELEKIKQAKEKIKDIVQQINERMRVVERVEQVLAVQKKIEDGDVRFGILPLLLQSQ